VSRANSFDNCHFVIPARSNSKGLPLKNQKLFKYTVNSIPSGLYDKVIVTTDDLAILDKCDNIGLDTIERKRELSLDDISIKDVLIDAVNQKKILDDDDIIMLYLTYPQRNFEDIKNAYEFYKSNNAESLLCRVPIRSNPFLCYYELDNNKGKKIIEHDLYRRQDYSPCFEASHFIAIMKARKLLELDNNLYSDNTIFYPINSTIDVDTLNDFMRFKSTNND
jgi:CMP-N-acetylneuraminic acid synthetase